MQNSLAFIPQSLKTIIADNQVKLRMLNLISFFISQTIEAIEALSEKNYFKFDAQVSENLCQIRAYYLCEFDRCRYDAVIRKFLLKSKELKIKRSKYQETVENINFKRRRTRKEKLIEKRQTIENFLLKEGLFFNISKEELFFSYLYFLTKFKLREDYKKETINYIKLSNVLGIKSKSFLKKLVHHAQKYCSIFSCRYIGEIYKRTSKDVSLINDILMMEDDIGRVVLPSFYVTKLILQDMLRRKYFVLLSVYNCRPEKFYNICFLFSTSSFFNKFFSISDEETIKYLDKTVLVIEGYTSSNLSEKDYRKLFSKFSAEDLILSNMAQHSQYPGKILAAYKENPFEEIIKKGNVLDDETLKELKELNKDFFKKRKFAITNGCSQSNTDLFLIKHIYCDTLLNSIKSSSEERSLFFMDSFKTLIQKLEVSTENYEKEETPVW